MKSLRHLRGSTARRSALFVAGLLATAPGCHFDDANKDRCFVDTDCLQARSCVDAVGDEPGWCRDSSAGQVELRAVYSGTAAIVANEDDAEVVLGKAVDKDRALLIFSARTNGSRPTDTLVSGQLVNPQTLMFQRSNVDSPYSINIHWHVVEYASGVRVQRGATAMDSDSVDVPIEAVDRSRAFPVITYRGEGASFDGTSFVRAELSQSSTLALRMNRAPEDMIVEWQVIEHMAASVQSGSVSFTSSDLRMPAITPAPFSASRSWLHYSYSATNGDGGTVTQKLVRGSIERDKNLDFKRTHDGSGIALTWYLVELLDGSTVTHDIARLNEGILQQTASIAPVDPQRSIVMAGNLGRGGAALATTTNQIGLGWFEVWLEDNETVAIHRGQGGGAGDLSWSVVQIGP